MTRWPTCRPDVARSGRLILKTVRISTVCPDGQPSIALQRKAFPMNGTVKWFNPAKGFGFIVPDGGGKDAFVHASAVEQAGLNHLVEGQRVEFELVADQRTGKPAAKNLKPIP
jgi:CspA family cold shock protein